MKWALVSQAVTSRLQRGPTLTAHSEILPFFRRLMLALRRAIASLMRRKASPELIRFQASAFLAGDLLEQGEVDLEGFLDRILAITEDRDLRRALLEELLRELEVVEATEAAAAVRARLEAPEEEAL
jgi:hypothetical protein